MKTSDINGTHVVDTCWDHAVPETPWPQGGCELKMRRLDQFELAQIRCGWTKIPTKILSKMKSLMLDRETKAELLHSLRVEQIKQQTLWKGGSASFPSRLHDIFVDNQIAATGLAFPSIFPQFL
jgi:hypothetical protein